MSSSTSDPPSSKSVRCTTGSLTRKSTRRTRHSCSSITFTECTRLPPPHGARALPPTSPRAASLPSQAAAISTEIARLRSRWRCRTGRSCSTMPTRQLPRKRGSCRLRSFSSASSRRSTSRSATFCRKSTISARIPPPPPPPAPSSSACSSASRSRSCRACTTCRPTGRCHPPRPEETPPSASPWLPLPELISAADPPRLRWTSVHPQPRNNTQSQSVALIVRRNCNSPCLALACQSSLKPFSSCSSPPQSLVTMIVGLHLSLSPLRASSGHYFFLQEFHPRPPDDSMNSRRLSMVVLPCALPRCLSVVHAHLLPPLSAHTGLGVHLAYSL
mmetsp:Transcript_26543/g.85764  ORF Transcript_26543/g.85764 Transcript_26543/m.85764 type:complete len:331 (-) Transcript_26543:36-1028(-)